MEEEEKKTRFSFNKSSWNENSDLKKNKFGQTTNGDTSNYDEIDNIKTSINNEGEFKVECDITSSPVWQKYAEEIQKKSSEENVTNLPATMEDFDSLANDYMQGKRIEPIRVEESELKDFKTFISDSNMRYVKQEVSSSLNDAKNLKPKEANLCSEFSCKNVLHKNAKFCSECGTKVVSKSCSQCDYLFLGNERFCSQCGLKRG